MPESILLQVACPSCTYPIDLRQHGRHVVCDACGSRFILQGHLCPVCHSYTKLETNFCGQCHTQLTRTCGKCRAINWSGDEYCIQCATPMDILDVVIKNHTSAVAKHREQHQEKVREIKQETLQASALRLADMQAAEELRQALIDKQRSKQRALDRLTVLVFLSLALVIVVATIYVSATT